MNKLFIASISLLLLLLLSPNLAPGQTGGRLSGKVLNAEGQGIGQAEVRLKKGTTVLKRTTTAADGTFTFEQLPPESYSVEIESSGRSRTSPQNVEIGTSPVNIDLSFTDQSSVTTTATVTPLGPAVLPASSPTIQADSAEVSRSYETRIVRSLPLIDRQYQDLISLMPGVTPPVITEDRISDPQRSRIYNVNGLPDYANTYYQDGSYNVERYSGRQSRIQPNASVQQLDVRTSNYNAEQGLAGGAHVNTTSRPGTNAVHGSGFFLHSNSFLTTRSPVNLSTANPVFNTNQFGGSAGGPIIKNKTFWFLGYEAYLRRGSTLQIDTVPTVDLRGGNFNQVSGLTLYNPTTGLASGANRSPFPNNRIPQASLNPLSQSLLNSLPLPNQPGFANNLFGTGALRDDQHRMDGKIDHRFSEKSTGFFRYGYTTDSVNRVSQLGALGNSADAEMRNHNAVASLTKGIGQTGLVEARVGYSRYRNAISPGKGITSLDGDLNRFGFTNGLPQITIAGLGNYGLPGNYPSKAVNDNWDAAFNGGFHNGIHYLKAGAQVITSRASGFDSGPFSPRGSFVFGSGGTSSPTAPAGSMNSAYNAFASFLIGSPTSSGLSMFQSTPTYRQTLTSGYVTDTINWRKNIHVELGVRYDVFSPLRTRFDNGAVTFNSTTNQLSSNNGATRDYDLNNFSPRIGLVIRPIERIAIRTAYAIQFFPQPFSLSGINQASTGSQVGLIGSFGTTGFTLPGTQAGAGSTPGLNANQPLSVDVNSGSRTPYVQTYSFMVQGDLGNGFLLDIGYVGNGVRQLPYSAELNAALPGTGTAGLPFASLARTAALTGRGNGLNSSYNALQVNLTKRFGAGLAIAGAYTFGKSLDNGFDQINPFSRSNNRGPADWDRKHILAISHLWQLPFGPGSAYFREGWAAQVLGSWQLNGILRWATGTPYSVFADPLSCNCPGVTAVRAVGAQDLMINGQSSFDPAAFSSVTPATFGNAGRNLFRGPDYFNYDISVFRSFPVRESINFELRAEAYNVTNSTNLANPFGLIGSFSGGSSVRTVNNNFGRQFQLGGRLLF
ncbi:MAG: TonB-dependent receptor [Bryobacteraceae bacterium]|nr:TonB-dependent receptor [Bryobacteraceae bacterium]